MFIQKEISVTVRGKGIHDITSIINEAIKKNEVSKGICNLFIKHTSASLIIQENADPAVLEDLNNFYDKVTKGGVILLDNYAGRGSSGKYLHGDTVAIDDFFKKKNVLIKKFHFAARPCFMMAKQLMCFFYNLSSFYLTTWKKGNYSI